MNQSRRDYKGYVNVLMHAWTVSRCCSASLFDSSWTSLCSVYLERFGGWLCVLELSVLLVAHRDWKQRSEASILYMVSFQFSWLFHCDGGVDIPMAFYKLVQLFNLDWSLFCFGDLIRSSWEHCGGVHALLNSGLLNPSDLTWLRLEVPGSGMRWRSSWLSDLWMPALLLISKSA